MNPENPGTMHELSIAQSILEIVLQHMPREEGVSCRSVRLSLGAMAGVVPDSLEFCFGAITEGTPLEGARLDIEHVALRAHCNSCGADGDIEPTLFVCGACGGTSLNVLSGREMQVRDIEIEEKEGVR